MFLEINYVLKILFMVSRFISSIHHHNEYDLYSWYSLLCWPQSLSTFSCEM